MIEQVAARAVERAIDRLEAAADALPDDVTIERTGDDLRLTGRRLRLRWIEDVRLRGFVLLAGRMR